MGDVSEALSSTVASSGNTAFIFDILFSLSEFPICAFVFAYTHSCICILCYIFTPPFPWVSSRSFRWSVRLQRSRSAVSCFEQFGIIRSLSFDRCWHCAYTYEQLFAVDLCFRNSSWMKRMPGVSNWKSLSWVPSSGSWRTGTRCCRRRGTSWWVWRRSTAMAACERAAVAAPGPQNIGLFPPLLFRNGCRSSCLLPALFI